MAETNTRALTPIIGQKAKENDVPVAIEQIRNLRIGGQYKGAVTRLEELITSLGPDIRLVLELGDLLFTQGFCDKAVQALEKYIDTNNVQDSLAFAATQLVHLFARFFVTAQLRILLDQAETIYADFLLGPYSEVVNDATVRIETYYCRFCDLATRCGTLDRAHIQNTLLPRLPSLFRVLLQRGDFFNALSVARSYYACCDGPEKTLLAAQLAGNQRTPSQYQAHAWLMLAKVLTADDQRTEQTDLYMRAREQFKDGNHVHGMLDVDIDMACRLPLEPAVGDVDEDLANMLTRYKSLDYPVGYTSALLTLLNTAHGLHNFQQESLIMDELESVYPASVSKLQWLMFQIQILSRRSLRGADSGKVVHGGEALWNELVDSDCKFFRGHAALLVSQAYTALKDKDNMVLWSQRAQDDLANTDLTAIPSLVKDFDLSTQEGLTSCYVTVLSLTNSSSPEYCPELVIKKIAVILNHIVVNAVRHPKSLDVIEAIITIYEENLARVTDQDKALVLLAKLRDSQVNLHIMRGSFRQDVELEIAALKPAKEAKDSYLQAKDLPNAIAALQREAILNVAIARKFEKAHDVEEHLAWENSTKLYRVAFESAAELGLVSLARECAYWVAHCQYRQWIKAWCSSEVLLKSLLVAEGFIDQQRQELSILRRMAAAIAKGRLSSSKQNRSIYQMAIGVCNVTDDVLNAWNWVQRSKARSLSDMLGLGVLIPHELMKRVHKDTTCLDLFQTEQHLAEELLASPDTDRFKRAASLEDHQRLMRKQAVLAELLDLRIGAPITVRDLTISSTGAHTEDKHKKAILFVDWVVSDREISLYVVKQGEVPVVRELPISIHEVHRWISRNLKRSDGATLTGMLEEDEPDEGPLRAMDTLVAPLVELSGAGDLLVLCPTDALHAIPLHALRLGSGDDRAGILHFIGHCDPNREAIIEQSLRLFKEKSSDHGESQPTSVTVKDLFEFNINVSHVSLLACASAEQKFDPGDEPLGLVTALLSAGAASVLGTIWPVQSYAARIFSEDFYRYLASSSQNQPGIYDLAYAMREAILDLKQRWEFRQPYYWAPFVLHGTWFLRGDLGLAKS